MWHDFECEGTVGDDWEGTVDGEIYCLSCLCFGCGKVLPGNEEFEKEDNWCEGCEGEKST
jgi:hypothetical protein